jgi:ABC-type phosphate transport system permease subunit
MIMKLIWLLNIPCPETRATYRMEDALCDVMDTVLQAMHGAPSALATTLLKMVESFAAQCDAPNACRVLVAYLTQHEEGEAGIFETIIGALAAVLTHRTCALISSIFSGIYLNSPLLGAATQIIISQRIQSSRSHPHSLHLR